MLKHLTSFWNLWAGMTTYSLGMGFWSKLLGARTPEERQNKWREEAKLELTEQPLVDRMAGIPPETVDMGSQLGIHPLYDPMSPEGQDVLESMYRENPTYPRWKINNAYSRRFTEVYQNQQAQANPEEYAARPRRTKASDQRDTVQKLLSHLPTEQRQKAEFRMQTQSPMILDAGSSVNAKGERKAWDSPRQQGLWDILFRK